MFLGLVRSMTPRGVVKLSRVTLAGGSAVLALLLVGPFQGVEHAFGLSDSAAHFLAFYLVSLTSLAAFPRVRRGDIGRAAIAFACFSEIAQWISGRDFGLADALADTAGVAAALAPTYLERLRFYARRTPYHNFAEISAVDPRRREEAAAIDGLSNAARRREARA